MEQARVAMCHAFEIAFKSAVSPFQPYGIYSIPEISSIGPSEQELRQKGIPYETGQGALREQPPGPDRRRPGRLHQAPLRPGRKKLLAAHILGEGATELVHIPMLVMSSGGTIDVFIDAVFNFPTLAEASSTPRTTASSASRGAPRAADSRPVWRPPRSAGNFPPRWCICIKVRPKH